MTEEVIRLNLDEDDSHFDDLNELNGSEDGWADDQDDEEDGFDAEGLDVNDAAETGLDDMDIFDDPGENDSADLEDPQGEDMAEPAADEARRPRRLRITDRLVKSLAAAQNEENYGPYVAPIEQKVS